MAPEESEVGINRPGGETSPNNGPAAAGPARPGPARIIFPVVIGILLVAVIALLATTRSQAGKLRRMVRAREIAEERADGLEQNLSLRLEELNDITDRLRLAEADRDQLQEEAAELLSGRNRLQARVENLENQNRDLTRQLRAEQAALAELREEFRTYRETRERPPDQGEKPTEDTD